MARRNPDANSPGQLPAWDPLRAFPRRARISRLGAKAYVMTR